MRVSEKGTKQYFPRQASAVGTRFQATKPYNGEKERERERERERARELESQRESGEDEEKRGRKEAKRRYNVRVSVVLTLRPNNKPAIAYISDS
jgi:hypothetical protein